MKYVQNYGEIYEVVRNSIRDNENSDFMLCDENGIHPDININIKCHTIDGINAFWLHANEKVIKFRSCEKREHIFDIVWEFIESILVIKAYLQ